MNSTKTHSKKLSRSIKYRMNRHDRRDHGVPYYRLSSRGGLLAQSTYGRGIYRSERGRDGVDFRQRDYKDWDMGIYALGHLSRPEFLLLQQQAQDSLSAVLCLHTVPAYV